MVPEQRPFERKAEEDDGKVSWCDGVSAGPPPPPPSCGLLLNPLKRRCGLREEAPGRGWEGGAAPQHSACHCVIVQTGRVTDTSRDSVAVVPFAPPHPPPSPHTPL